MDNIQLGYMQMPSGFRYRNVFIKGYPGHDGWDSFRIKHPPMPASRWAKIFSPFDALKGFDEAIGSGEELYVDRIELMEDERKKLNRKLEILKRYTINSRTARTNRIMVTVEYFVPCTDRDNTAFDLQQGKYENVSGMVLYVDDMKETIRLKTGSGDIEIEFAGILTITADNGTLFDNVGDGCKQ